MGQVQEADNQLNFATRTYERVLSLVGDPPRGLASEAHIGLARIHYEWNSLDTARQHAQQCLQLTRQGDSVDTFVSYAVFVARAMLARGEVPVRLPFLMRPTSSCASTSSCFGGPILLPHGCSHCFARAILRRQRKWRRSPSLLSAGPAIKLATAEAAAALTLLEPWRVQVEARGWADEQLKVMVVTALALRAHGDRDQAVQMLFDVLERAEPRGFFRSFVDEGAPMAELLAGVAAYGGMTDYIRKLLAAFECGKQTDDNLSDRPAAQPLVEPLSRRELEVLRLITQGLSNNEIGERLTLALDTVKGHNRRIFGKLQVQRRTEAVARARELGLT